MRLKTCSDFQVLEVQCMNEALGFGSLDLWVLKTSWEPQETA